MRRRSAFESWSTSSAEFKSRSKSIEEHEKMMVPTAEVRLAGRQKFDSGRMHVKVPLGGTNSVPHTRHRLLVTKNVQLGHGSVAESLSGWQLQHLHRDRQRALGCHGQESGLVRNPSGDSGRSGRGGGGTTGRVRAGWI